MYQKSAKPHKIKPESPYGTRKNDKGTKSSHKREKKN